jgi:hypothetical protein
LSIPIIVLLTGRANWYLARIGDATSPHALSALAIGLILLGGTYVYRSWIKAAFVALSAFGIHELVWLIFFFVEYKSEFTADLLTNSLYIILCVLLVFGLKASKLERKPFLIFAVFAFAFDIIWSVMFGFKITIYGLTGLTPYYQDLTANMLEDWGWLLPSIALVIVLLLPKFKKAFITLWHRIVCET